MVATHLVRVLLPTPYGPFDLHAFRCEGGFVYLALVRGEVKGASGVLTRLHSECLTGDALGSLRCDCGVQLRTALKAIAVRDRGVLVYATGHEGRGIGLLAKLEAYVAQDAGADTVDANLHLGLPVDSRSYTDAADVLTSLAVRSVRLLTNNPSKTAGLEYAGVVVDEMVPLATAGHARNHRYLATKQARLGHVRPTGSPPARLEMTSTDVSSILGPVQLPSWRPYIVIKYAQSVDGRIATSTGDSRWISGEAERALSHGLRAACDAVLVGAGTIVSDDPLLTVRLVDGASPRRVVVDSRLRVPVHAAVFGDEAVTTIVTTALADAGKRGALERKGVELTDVGASEEGVDLVEAVAKLRRSGIESLLVEGGARVITSLLRKGLVDRIVVAVAPILLGSGTEAVGDLGIARVCDGLRLSNRSVHVFGDDVVMTWDVASDAGASADSTLPDRPPAD
jgi:3,4-dihydroxy 2-butanone 4-phosphate synthase/GTP cyclohydrolase II